MVLARLSVAGAALMNTVWPPGWLASCLIPLLMQCQTSVVEIYQDLILFSNQLYDAVWEICPCSSELYVYVSRVEIRQEVSVSSNL